ncbi:MAG: BspA family leucine-rich repeat surface protein [Proteobacteria bacterium]|nr:BspA family leucine-rich repeat surface protein [Pseudomonadota bacterium]
MTKFNQPLDNWDTSNVTSMTGMFRGATAFNQPLNDWDTSNVTDMSNMFARATAFNQPLDYWNISKVINMDNIFQNSNLTSINYCKLFRGPYSSYWSNFKDSLGRSYNCN